jgi:hypothetical protein
MYQRIGQGGVEMTEKLEDGEYYVLHNGRLGVMNTNFSYDFLPPMYGIYYDEGTSRSDRIAYVTQKESWQYIISEEKYLELKAAKGT